MNMKTSIFNLRIISRFCMDFYATKQTEVKKREVIDTNYFWYRGAVEYK